MSYIKGDSITLSAAPKVWLDKYRALSPHASITRVLGDDPERDIAAATRDLHLLLHESLRVEIEFLNEAYDALQGATTTDALLALCKRKMTHVQPVKIIRKKA